MSTPPDNQQPSTTTVLDEENSKKFCALFGPIHSHSQKDFEKLFSQEGISDWVEISIRNNGNGLIRFKTEAETEAFVEKAKRIKLDSNEMWAKIFGTSNNDNKTLHIIGYDEIDDVEREIYFMFAKYGIIRKVTARRNYSFVQFDSADDARRAIQDRSSILFRGSKVKINYANKDVNGNTEIRKPYISLTHVLPADHPYWKELKARFA